MKQVFLFMSICVASGILFANVYTSLVDARSWGSDIPNSIAVAREYFKVVTPANFFRMISPLNQLLALTVVILFWRSSPAIRLSLSAALAMYVAVDVLTFTYFYPRNALMFTATPLSQIDVLRETWASWSGMNWVRSLILLAGVVLSCLSLHNVYSLPKKG